MASVIATPARVESRAKAVQELSTAAASPPEKYIVKDGIGGTDFPVLEIPVLDFSLLTSSSPEGQNEIEKLRLAFSSCGYVQAVNHGIEDSFLDEVHGVSREFFSLPVEEKMKSGRPSDDIDGYGNDMVYSEKQTLDWNDRLYLHVKPESLRKLKVWPENPKDFRNVLLELAGKVEKMNETILRAMAKSLELEDEECFIKQYGENPIVLSRFNLYPPCPRPDVVLAAKAHGDASAMTYLLQDKEVEGLQTIKDGQWYTVPIIPNAIVVNVGDQVEIMTNGIFKSPIHRVVTNAQRNRSVKPTPPSLWSLSLQNRKLLLLFLEPSFVCAMLQKSIGWLMIYWASHSAFRGLKCFHLVPLRLVLFSWLDFLYTTFWVFFTPVMFSVAKSFGAPIKLLFPTCDSARPFSMLGLGDIVIPGIFVALALRFDVSRGKESQYFKSAFLGYTVGLVLTIIVMNWFKAAQPCTFIYRAWCYWIFGCPLHTERGGQTYVGV